MMTIQTATNEVATMLVLSTGHLTELTCNTFLTSRTAAYAKADYGWFVHVGDEAKAGDPTDLQSVLTYARNAGHAWVMFDMDGGTVDGLDYYEWSDGTPYAHDAASCPSKHWNDGDDICGDCGLHLG